MSLDKSVKKAGIQGKVGDFEFRFLKAPRGATGSVSVEILSGPRMGFIVDLCWRLDADGIWIETPDSVEGFDIQGELNDEGLDGAQNGAQNGATMRYSATRRLFGDHRVGLSFVREGQANAAAGVGGKKKGMRVRAQMPGKIVRILVKAGDTVEKDQSLLVMEAMKMENEIRAQAPSRVDALKVVEGQAVESGADLMTLSAVD